ncbi:NADPH-dependent F420 reductase [Kineococcus rubinsiae]|uniref:NADPH-dependent F420 reductase n=1 Tax=Kineococcus rubinsiae TaxID=2609562 RepID=UPI001430231F|nr:NADPH-dependent F420 reductase [Kineococcus rubinsiae]NIZ92225.1 NADPH-dependent F420 reductase [Kineococcus rubinsiae]
MDTLDIAIIGAGNIGGNLTRLLTGLGHRVRVANSRGPESLADLAAETGATAVTNAEAAAGADLVVVTVPMKAVPQLPGGLLDGVADGTVVVDTCNYYPRERDGRIDALEDGTPETVWVAQHLDPSSRLRWVKAFNGIHAEHLLTAGRPAGDPERRALPIAGDDAAAKARVGQLLDAVGFDVVDAGSLADSWHQQPGTPVYGAEAGVDGITEALAEAPRERPEAFRG